MTRGQRVKLVTLRSVAGPALTAQLGQVGVIEATATRGGQEELRVRFPVGGRDSEVFWVRSDEVLEEVGDTDDST